MVPLRSSSATRRIGATRRQQRQRDPVQHRAAEHPLHHAAGGASGCASTRTNTRTRPPAAPGTAPAPPSRRRAEVRRPFAPEIASVRGSRRSPSERPRPATPTMRGLLLAHRARRLHPPGDRGSRSAPPAASTSDRMCVDRSTARSRARDPRINARRVPDLVRVQPTVGSSRIRIGGAAPAAHPPGRPRCR
jgi:hypothetical protein